MPLRELRCESCAHTFESLEPPRLSYGDFGTGECPRCSSAARIQATGACAPPNMGASPFKNGVIPATEIPKRPTPERQATKRRDLRCVECGHFFEADVPTEQGIGAVVDRSCPLEDCGGDAEVVLSAPNTMLTTREFMGTKAYRTKMKERCRKDSREALMKEPEKAGFVSARRPLKTWRSSYTNKKAIKTA